MAKLGRKTPCYDCPFRVNARPGWLGADRPVPFLAKSYYGEVDMPCHTAIDYADPDWINTQEPDADLCAGALILMRNGAKLPRDPKLAEAVRAVEPSKKVFRTPANFLDHHEKLPGRQWTHREAQGAVEQYFSEAALVDLDES